MADLIPIQNPEQSFFFGAPIAADSEMSAEDPLALDYIAQQIGLILLPGLTTRSSRAQGFAMVLYGLNLVEVALSHYGLPDKDEVRRTVFEQWERFWALATLEYRQGQLQQSDGDNMRGVRGAKRAWSPGDRPLGLDFQLISRQSELGSLGAYLVPLRRSGLVIDGTLRPSPAALDIIDAFWDERVDGSRASRFDPYALLAVEPGRKRIERKFNGVTLATLGERSRLMALVARQRRAQQDRLQDALFTHARDPHSQAVAGLVLRAAKAGIAESRALLDVALDGHLGPVGGELADLLRTARLFGDVMAALLATFDRVYATLDRAGWIARREAIAAAALPATELAEVRALANAFLSAPLVREIRRLPMHGAALLSLLEHLRGAGAEEVIGQMLGYHASVQRERRRGSGWIRAEGDQLILGVTTYSARPESTRFPSYKLNVVRSLLVDTGCLSVNGAHAQTEVREDGR